MQTIDSVIVAMGFSNIPTLAKYFILGLSLPLYQATLYAIFMNSLSNISQHAVPSSQLGWISIMELSQAIN